MDKDICRFTENVGAIWVPALRKYFRRKNYFLLEQKFLIVKISRVCRPFWGVRKVILDKLRKVDYFLVLLKSDREGWLFSKKEVKENIEGDQWRLQKDGDYKINYTNKWLQPNHNLRNHFNSHEKFLMKMREYDS